MSHLQIEGTQTEIHQKLEEDVDIAINANNNSNAKDILIKQWMNQKGYKISDDAITKLKDEGFVNISDLEACSWDEISEIIKEMGVKAADKVKIKRVMESFGSKSKIIDPEEIYVIKAVNLKIKTLSNQIDRMKQNEEELDHEKTKLEYEITSAFSELMRAINMRKTEIMKELDSVICNEKNEIKKKQKTINMKFEEIVKIKNENDVLVNKPINIDDLDQRKSMILTNQKRVDQIQIESQFDMTQIRFLFETQNALKFIGDIGVISNMCAPIVEDVSNDKEDIAIKWKIKKDEKLPEIVKTLSLNDVSGVISGIGSAVKPSADIAIATRNAIIKVEISHSHILIENDDIAVADAMESKQEWNVCQFEIDENKNNEYKQIISAEKTGIYHLKMRYFDSNEQQWSPFCKIQKITIDKIGVAIDSVILTKQEKKMLEKILMENVIQKRIFCFGFTLNLIFRRSEHGKYVDRFHELCDNKNQLLFVIHSKFDHVCGAFENICLTRSGGYKSDDNCFLYLLRSTFDSDDQLIPQVWNVENKDKAVKDYSGWYPGWGYGECLWVGESGSYCRNDATFNYESGNVLLGGLKYDQSNGKHRAGDVKEYEVYQLVYMDTEIFD